MKSQRLTIKLKPLASTFKPHLFFNVLVMKNCTDVFTFGNFETETLKTVKRIIH